MENFDLPAEPCCSRLLSEVVIKGQRRASLASRILSWGQLVIRPLRAEELSFDIYQT